MQNMQFRDYVFRHNPAKIRVSSRNLIAEDFLPGKGGVTRGLGKVPRQVVCSGSFSGANAADALEQAAGFRRSTAHEQSGVLFLPGMEPFTAQLREFVMEAEGDGRVIPYTITFVETGAGL
ncbi:MAG: hypothetical protein FWH02_05815 [Oscillospiraceae bacterium]|nr:hypothetical protein [Oscillospiraceae bacterium]